MANILLINANIWQSCAAVLEACLPTFINAGRWVALFEKQIDQQSESGILLGRTVLLT